jgi:hypothetical protein
MSSRSCALRAAAVLLLGLALSPGCRRGQKALPGPDQQDGDVFPGKPVVRLCKKEWSQEECCAFLCRCLASTCADSPLSRPGMESCRSWCPSLSDKDVRCHVFHCYVSVSPKGGIKDHDSHCPHAAHQLPGGACPSLVYER